MHSILVVCGAGASSTFLVHWMRKVAASRGLVLTIEAGSLEDLGRRLPELDAVLVGTHLGESFPQLKATAAAAGVSAVLLPALRFDAAGASAALELLEDVLATSPAQTFADQTFADQAFADQASVVPGGPHYPGSLMAEHTVRIASTHGLHARPASIFTQAAAAVGVPVQLAKGDKSVNAASILGVISLGINFGDEVTLSAEGDNAEQALTDLAALLSTDFDAD